MKKFYFLLLALIVAVTANAAWTVKFTNPNNWTKVNVYAWLDGGTSVTGGWPGSAMTKEGNVWVYNYTGSEVPAKIIFNNGSAQTNDLPFTPNATYNMDGIEGQEITYSNIYVPYSSFESTACNIYSWSPALFGAWPGAKMEKTTVEGIEFWTIKINDNLLPCTTNIKLNGGGKETGDITGLSISANTVIKANGQTMTLDEYIAENPTVTYSNIYVPYSLYEKADANIYTWQPELFGGWPGSAMEKTTVNGNEFWTIQINSDQLPVTVAGWKLSGSDGDSGDLPSATFEADHVILGNGTTVPVNDYVATDPVITYQIRGQIFGNADWADYDMTEVNGEWVYEGTPVEGDFGIKQLKDGVQVAWINSSDNGQITQFGNYDCVSEATDASNFHYAISDYTGNVKFTFNPETMVLAVSDPSTGITTLDAENAVAEYFNLQGMRVAQPQSGNIYICRRGTQVSKVLVK